MHVIHGDWFQDPHGYQKPQMFKYLIQYKTVELRQFLHPSVCICGYRRLIPWEGQARACRPWTCQEDGEIKLASWLSRSWVREHYLYFNFAPFLLKLMITPSVFCCHLYIVLCLVAQSCPTLCEPMYCSLLGSSVNGDNPGKKTRMGCHVLLQGIFPTLGWNLGLPTTCRSLLSEPPEALYSHQKQDQELTVVQIMNSLLQNSSLNWRK